MVAVAADWPGFERGGKTEDESVEKLARYVVRYLPVAKRVGLDSELANQTDPDIIGRYPGVGSTDFWGSRSRPRRSTASRSTPRPSTARSGCFAPRGPSSSDGRRLSAELRPGIRGGGRSRDGIVRHVLVTEGDDFSKRVNAKSELDDLLTPGGLVGHVVDAAVGDEDRARDALGRNVRKRGTERRKQARSLALAVIAAGIDRAHLEAGNSASFSASAARASSVTFSRSPKRWLALLSMTSATTEESGSRSSRVKEGLASASKASASASARRKEPRERERIKKPATTSAAIPAASSAGRGSSGSKANPYPIAAPYWPSRSNSAGTCTWSAL